MTTTPPWKTKLIEKALPLQAINEACAREKSIRHGHPSTLHLWWARRPLAACRAVIWASLVDDPSAHPDEFPTEEAQEAERQRLFKILEQLVVWENSTNEDVLAAARAEIEKSTDGNPPPILDPFAGGGSIPLEAHRLGLEAHASDLNPIPVLINKAMIEIPPRFRGQAPVNPTDRANLGSNSNWPRATGLAADVAYYGRWMREQAWERIGHLYPQAETSDGDSRDVVAWLWARTVPSPNPALNGARTPLVSNFWLSKKAGKEHYIVPEREGDEIRFHIKSGVPEDRAACDVGSRVARAGDFVCMLSGAPIARSYIRECAKSGQMGAQLLAVVIDKGRGRGFVEDDQHRTAVPLTSEETEFVAQVRDEYLSGATPTRAMITGGVCSAYGLDTWGSLFSPRQIIALATFSDLVHDAREQVRADAIAGGMEEGERLAEGGNGAAAYADAVATYLAFAVSRMTDYSSTLCSWHVSGEKMRNTFGRQALPMVWDYAEVNPFSTRSGNFLGAVEWVEKVVAAVPAAEQGAVEQHDALTSVKRIPGVVISTDPPYYDNISYAVLADYFYVWLRRSLGDVLDEDGGVRSEAIWPNLLSTLLTPKTEELIKSPHRHGGEAAAKEHFERGMEQVFGHILQSSSDAFPTTVYYAFKQTDADLDGRASTGWETMLEALKRSGFEITATWPMRTEMANRTVGIGANALASSVVLVCRPLPVNAPEITRRDFVRELREELPRELEVLHQGQIAPVDVPQSAIGPGMRIFTRYKSVLGDDGEPIGVREALRLINQVLAEVVSETEGDFDKDTRWAIQWFRHTQFTAADSGDADNIARATNTSIQRLVDSGIAEAGGGKTRLFRPEELPDDWDPTRDRNVPVWEVTHHLIRVLNTDGEPGAARLLAKVGAVGEQARDLAYTMYATCDELKLAGEAGNYNQLVASWSSIRDMAADVTSAGEQEGLF